MILRRPTAKQMMVLTLWCCLLLTGHYIGYLPDHYAAQWVASGRMRALDPARYHYDLALSAVPRKGRRPHLVLESFLDALAGGDSAN